jgi:hypothetical protein
VIVEKNERKDFVASIVEAYDAGDTARAGLLKSRFESITNPNDLCMLWSAVVSAKGLHASEYAKWIDLTFGRHVTDVLSAASVSSCKHV